MRCTHTFALSPYTLVLLIFGLVFLLIDLTESAANQSKRPLKESNVVVTQARGKSTVARVSNGNPIPQPQYKASTEISVQRNIKDWRLEDFLLIATVDGSLHACERDTGKERWSLNGEGSVVKATKGNRSHEHTIADDVTWIVEPLGKGALYYFTPDNGLQKLPITIEQLVLESPLRLSGDNNHYTGMRQTRMYSVDARTGKILKTYGTGSSIDRNATNELELEDDDDDWNTAFGTQQKFMVGKTEYRLEIESDEGVVWSISYTSWGPNNMDADLAIQHTTSPDNLYVYSSHDGNVFGVDYANEGRTWARLLPSPAITTFDVMSSYQSIDGSEELVVLPQPLVRDPVYEVSRTSDIVSTFVNRTNDGGWYALSEQNFPFLVRRAPVALWNLGVIPIGSEDQYHSLVGVHDSHRPQTVFPHYRIDGPSTGELITPELEGEILSHGSRSISIPMRAVVDLSLAAPILIAILLLYRSRPIRDFFAKIGPSDSEIAVQVAETETPVPEVNVKAEAPPEVSSVVAEEHDEFGNANETIEDSFATANDRGATATPTVKRRRRGNRGGRKNGNGGPKDADAVKATNDATDEKTTSTAEENTENVDADGAVTVKTSEVGAGKKPIVAEEVVQTVVIVDDHSRKPVEESLPSISSVLDNESKPGNLYKINALEVSDAILGYGSHGTVVYKGMFEKREVAVKRMLLDFYDVASHEVSLLLESDDHPNVVRYFCKQESQRFLYIALELCPATLQDVVERPNDFSDLVARMDLAKVLYQIANGLQYLHSLKIVHRDIKPQNILVAPPKQSYVGGQLAPARLLISDFGLCKKLEGDQSSFRATTAHAAGTSGWRAPELLIEADDSGSTSSHTLHNHSGSTSEPAVIDTLSNRRATRAIDIFSLGCVFYYVLSNGAHPFGDRYMREANIIKGDYSIQLLDILGSEGVEAKDLIKSMLGRDPHKRPSAAQVMIHPFFWPAEKKLNFLLEASDRFEIEIRDPPSELLLDLESDPQHVVYNDWWRLIDRSMLDNLAKYRKYNPTKVLDLLRAMRNKRHHFQDLSPSAQHALGTTPGEFLSYFAQRFPNLLMHVYFVVWRHLKYEPHFEIYFRSTT
ncbi:hypothetical protein V1512DRAFT_230236 [Lipomyces arxii]|uniref:uncharacterized protein n=1 Tax=Lipomyces arxii TaxID=56418 RepID=UPI0034CDFF72